MQFFYAYREKGTAQETKMCRNRQIEREREQGQKQERENDMNIGVDAYGIWSSLRDNDVGIFRSHSFDDDNAF